MAVQGGRRYFLIKSNSQANVALSINKGVWSTQVHNHEKFNEAFHTSESVYLVYSVAGSGCYQGFAQMTSPVRPEVGVSLFGQQFRVSGLFDVKWVVVAELPSWATDHLQNRFNDGEPVKFGRDGQEIDPEAGEMLLDLLRQAAKETGQPGRSQQDHRPPRYRPLQPQPPMLPVAHHMSGHMGGRPMHQGVMAGFGAGPLPFMPGAAVGMGHAMQPFPMPMVDGPLGVGPLLMEMGFGMEGMMGMGQGGMGMIPQVPFGHNDFYETRTAPAAGFRRRSRSRSRSRSRDMRNAAAGRHRSRSRSLSRDQGVNHSEKPRPAGQVSDTKQKPNILELSYSTYLEYYERVSKERQRLVRLQTAPHQGNAASA